MALDSYHKEAKNSISSKYAWIYLVEIEYETDKFLRYTNDNQTLQYNGEYYYPMPFNISDVTESKDSKITTRKLSLGNADGIIGGLVAAYNGFTDSNVTLLLGQRNIIETYGNIARIEYYQIMRADENEEYMVFEMGIPNVNIKDFPSVDYSKDYCPYEYGGKGCVDPSDPNQPDTTTYPTCNRSYADCQERSNDERFGAFPSFPYGSLSRGH